MMKLIKFHTAFLLLLLLYLVFNLFLLFTHPGLVFNRPDIFGEPISTYGSRDASLYAKMAWQLIHEGIYGYNATVPNAYVTYGQPFYLVAVFKVAELFNTNHIMLYRLSNMILNIGAFILIYVIAQKLFHRRVISLIGAFLFAVHPAPTHYFQTALTETPTIFLFLLTTFIFIVALQKGEYRYHILFGIVASILLMFRASPALLLWLAWGIVVYRNGFKKGVKTGLIWCIGPILVMAPWAIRNYLMFGHMYLFSSHGSNPLIAGTNPFYLDDLSLYEQQAKELGMSIEEFSLHKILTGLRENFPLYFSWLTIGKTTWLFVDQAGNPDGLGAYAHLLPNWMEKISKYQNLLTVAVGFLFALIYCKRKPVLCLVLSIIIYICFSNVFLTLPRYGLLIYPFLCMLTGYGLVDIGTKVTKHLKERKGKVKETSAKY
ncbi:ArnT family glycosyltransferase [Priestia endophytica]|uniref:ArnT family glycosyltransferase n=1 Tax=Priestia endophytica TaxID=135735 RepID=UPI00203E9DB9|nr:glycosyltransferase family 39 protein [Priestia endophytica]MCM3540269.1 glycosyltransferase family 39 protein [Priestia endophytica]